MDTICSSTMAAGGSLSHSVYGIALGTTVEFGFKPCKVADVFKSSIMGQYRNFHHLVFPHMVVGSMLSRTYWANTTTSPSCINGLEKYLTSRSNACDELAWKKKQGYSFCSDGWWPRLSSCMWHWLRLIFQAGQKMWEGPHRRVSVLFLSWPWISVVSSPGPCLPYAVIWFVQPPMPHS